MTLTIGGIDHTAHLLEGSLFLRKYGAMRSSFGATLYFNTMPEGMPKVGQEIQVSHKGSVIWGGILVETEGECHSPTAATLQLRGQGYEHLLQRFCLPVIELGEMTPGDAAIHILNNYFPSTDGLTLGTVDPGPGLSNAYTFYPAKASSVFDFLAAENGYHWWVDENKTFHMRGILPNTEASVTIDLTEQDENRLKDLQTLTFTQSVAGFRNVQYAYNKSTLVSGKAMHLARTAEMMQRYGSGQYGAATASSAIGSVDDALFLAEQAVSAAPGTDEITFTTDADFFSPGQILSVTAPICGIEKAKDFCVSEIRGVYLPGRFRYTVTAKQSANALSETGWETILAKRSETESR